MQSKHPLYTIWANMLQRCNNPKSKGYLGAGITISDEWVCRDGFLAFKADMGDKPADHFILGRADINKGFSKENCHWTTRNTIK